MQLQANPCMLWNVIGASRGFHSIPLYGGDWNLRGFHSMEVIQCRLVTVCNALPSRLPLRFKSLHLQPQSRVTLRCNASFQESKAKAKAKQGVRFILATFTGLVLCLGVPNLEAANGAEECTPTPSSSMSTSMVRADELPLTNEGIVDEAWRVVNENFFDARSHKWTSQSWLRKKEEVLSSPISTRSAAHDIIRRMLAGLNDPYTRFLTPSEFTKMAKYDITGIGINIREIRDVDGMIKLKVLGIVLDGPAHSVGVKQGDEILSVDGQSVVGMPSFEAASLIQGPKETFVSIKVKHGNCGDVESFNIQRTQVARTPIYYRLENDEAGKNQIGYIRIKEFNSVAKRDLVTAVQRLKEGGASQFVLDLRDNPGGLVQAGIEIAKLFLRHGEMVIYTVGRDNGFQESVIVQDPAKITTPLMVLVNGRTASASEIVAAALHDNCRAILVGERTFGKGLIQSVYELRDGSAVVVTVGKYVTPSNKDIDGNGITPDFSRKPGWVEANETLRHCRATADLL